jgi:ketosteroid isomerase-like protein
MRNIVIVALMSIATTSAAQAPIAGPEATAELTSEIRARDGELFDAVFNRCDVAALSAIVADDLEFFHDKNGLMATSGKQWIEGVAGMCKRQADGTDYRAAREVVAGSDAVYPLNNYGAIHAGTHRFLAVSGPKKGQVLEVSRFFDVWKKEGATWRLSRVFSYDHRVD